ncbi:fibronectin type III domain-containing protein [Catalinimonas sp. 4WD22]|uniref:fibronectin type III domain-containing protein n=1 Tax=Catalinimonas locisalis TaxID=3133978 RepID=UPI00310185C8
MLIRWVLIGVLLIAGGNLYAQNRPVNATLQITPPYSVYLADYARPGSEQMQVYLLLRDLSEPVYDVQLRLTIEGSGIRLQTNPSYLPPPITLEGGIPLIVSGETLAPYLDSRNLVFSGISRAEYEQRRALPEGFYQFTIEVLDYRRADRSLSRPATFMAWFTLNEPPRITAPICGTTLPLMDPTHILFQWMDGGNINPASPFSTEYELTLVEVFPTDRNVDDAIRSSIPLLQTTTTETSYLYGLTDAALIPGQKYAFRVRALDIEGRAVFKNEGYSEVCSFTFGEGLLLNPPDGIRVYAENARKALVNWHLSIDPDSYRVEYRRKTAQEEEALSWFSIETSDKQVVLRDLEPETTYELRVASLFNNYVSRYSQLQTFITPEVIVAACGTVFSPNITASSIPLATAMAGQYWQVGDFEMQLREVRGGDGIFSGWGVMHVPYLSLQIPVKFDEVWVDEDYNLVQGEVVALSENLEAFQKRWEEEHPPQPEEDQEALAQQKTVSDSQPDQQSSAQEEITNIIVDGEIAQVYVNEQGQVIAVDAQGQEAIVAEEAPQEGEALAVEDSQGNKYSVDGSGGVHHEKSSSSTNSNSDKQVNFDNALLLAILDEFEEAVNAWLEVHGKGPLSEKEMRVLASLPEGFPADAELLSYISEHTFQQVRENTASFQQDLTNHQSHIASLLKQDEASLNEEELAQVKKAVALQITFYGLIDELKEFLNEIGLNGGCLDQGIQKAKEVFWQRMKEDYSLEKVVVLAVNAGEVEALYCLSSRENCPSQGDWGQFACGATHALVEEIDVNGMLDAGTEAVRAYIKNRTDCLTQGTELVSVFSSENPSDIIRTLNQCFLGIDIGPEEATQLYDATTAYVAAHYDDPYDQGRATVFVLSILSPFGKVKQLSKAFKLKLLDKLKKLGSPADELTKLRKAIDAEDIGDIRVAIGAAARGIDNLSAKSKSILESWPDDVYNKFYDEVASTELWDNTFKNAANQDGLVDAWKALHDAGIDDLATKIDEIKFVNNYLKSNPGKTAEQVSSEVKSKGWQKWVDETSHVTVTIFKAGDKIAGRRIIQVKAGSNGKIAVIGRKMDAHVNDVVSTLQAQGKQVEAFNDAYQSSYTFDIDGNTYSWQEIVDDFSNTSGQYATNSKGWITDEAIPKTLMYKANQKWAQKLIDKDYEVIDIGYPLNVNNPSLFYNMELNTIFP